MIRTCFLHRYHSPRLSRLVSHHILPQAWGGRDVWQGATNTADVCDTGHYNVHNLIDEWLLAAETDTVNSIRVILRWIRPPWTILRDFGPSERALAEEATWRYGFRGVLPVRTLERFG